MSRNFNKKFEEILFSDEESFEEEQQKVEYPSNYYVDSIKFSDVLKSIGIETDLFDDIILPFTLMPHQVKGLHLGLVYDRFGLYDEMRTGKTIIMQLIALFYARYNLKTVLLMPPVLFDQFVDTFNEIKNHGLKIKVLSGTAKAKQDLLDNLMLGVVPAPDVMIMTKEMFGGPHGKKGKYSVKNYEKLMKSYHNLTWDECHIGTQDEGSTIFKAVEKFTDKEDSRLILSTGTPINSELKGIYPQIRLKTPEAYKSRRHFDYQHVIYNNIVVRSNPTPTNPSGERSVNVIDGYKDVETLHSWLYTKATRALRSQVLDVKLPNIQTIPISLSGPHLKLYKHLIKTQIAQLSETEIADLTQQQALRQFALRMITDPTFAGEEGEKIKDVAVIQAIKTLLETVNVSDNKVLLFANFNHSVEYLATQFQYLNPAVIYGPNSSEKNREEIRRFKTNADCRMAVLNPQTGGVGVTFGDVTQFSIFAEPVSVPGLFEQAASRTILRGQKEPSITYILRIKDTLSEKMIERMLKKGSEIQEVVKDKRSLMTEFCL